jgi:hypothetical protein
MTVGPLIMALHDRYHVKLTTGSAASSAKEGEGSGAAGAPAVRSSHRGCRPSPRHQKLRASKAASRDVDDDPSAPPPVEPVVVAPPDVTGPTA